MAEFALRSLAQTFVSGHRIEPHSHRWAQLIYAASGTMRVVAEGLLWLVPPTRALWVPPGTFHAIEMRGSVAMRTIYVPVEQCAQLEAGCHAIEVSPLLREVILHVVQLQLLRAEVPEQLNLTRVFVDLVAASEQMPLVIPLPRDDRAAAVARLLQGDPARGDGLDALASEVGASERTLQRLFRRETGMPFVQWRQRLRLIHGVTALHMGASVTEAGANAGYSSTSAFIAAFRQQTGETPGRHKSRS